MKHAWLVLALAVACTQAPSSSDDNSGAGGRASGSGGKNSDGDRGGSGGSNSGSGGSAATGSGGSAPSGAGGSAATGSGGSAASGSGGNVGSGGASGTGGASGSPDGGGSPAETGAPPAAGNVAGELDGLFYEVKCTDKPNNGFCHHSGMLEQKIKFGGDAGKSYDVTLKVWAIAEGIKFSGGEPQGMHFYVGGMSATPRYSPCGLKIADKTYWLNRKDDRANDKVYKFEYTTPAIKIPGGAELLLYCTDDANKHISLNNPPPLGNAANGRFTIEAPPERLKAKLGMQPFGNTFIYLEVASATASP